MTPRTELVPQLVELIGSAATLLEVGDGWPAIVDLTVEGEGSTRVAAHVGSVISMARRGAERVQTRPTHLRFENPGRNRPPSAPPGMVPLLIGVLPGIDGDPPALVVPEDARVGQRTRFSVHFPGSFVYRAATTGYEPHRSRKGEQFVAITPPLLPALALARQRGVELVAARVRTAVQGTAPPGADYPPMKVRARAAATRLVRSATFRRRVLDAYGAECILCGLAMDSLLQAAHLYPVELPGSADETSNGVPTCPNHHALLDAHWLHINPGTFAVAMHPRLTAPGTDPALRALAAMTRSAVTVPVAARPQRVSRWLERRYAAYPDRYGWAPRG